MRNPDIFLHSGFDWSKDKKFMDEIQTLKLNGFILEGENWPHSIDSILEQLRGKTVLLVDWNPDAIKLLVMRAEPFDITIFRSFYTDEALEMYADKHPDAIFCDDEMPFMDGVEFAKQIRLRDQFHE
jgi:PleD family two-component response regulator